MATQNAINMNAPFVVSNGGTGATTFTAHGVLVGEGTSAITPLSVGTNGQVLLGSTGADPAFATLTSGDSSITFTTGAGSLSMQTKFIQQVSATTTSTFSTTTQFATTNTIPQNTGGTEIITITITPKSSSNTLYIVADIPISTGTACQGVLAIFQDSTANALAARAMTLSATGRIYCHRITHIMTAGTTSATTFKARVGPNASATLQVNEISSTRVFGGVSIAMIYVYEIGT